MKQDQLLVEVKDLKPYSFGAFEDNDPSKRLLFIANDNNDVGDYWEWSDTGWTPIDLSNEAYKLGVITSCMR